MFRNTSIVLFLALMLKSISLYAAPVEVYIDHRYEPYMYSEDKKAMGLYTNLIDAIFQRMDVAVDVKGLPWKRALKLSQQGDGGIGGIYKNDKRLEIYDYSEPLFAEKLLVYVHKGREFPFSKIDDLKGKIVGLNLGWSYGEDIDKARAEGIFEVREAKDNTYNLKKLLHKRVDCIIADNLSADKIIRKLNLGDQIYALPEPIANNNGFLAFSKGSNNMELLNKFNKTLAEMKADQSYQKIIDDFLAQ